jgi:hypothetical protein
VGDRDQPGAVPTRNIAGVQKSYAPISLHCDDSAAARSRRIYFCSALSGNFTGISKADSCDDLVFWRHLLVVPAQSGQSRFTAAVVSLFRDAPDFFKTTKDGSAESSGSIEQRDGFARKHSDCHPRPGVPNHCEVPCREWATNGNRRAKSVRADCRILRSPEAPEGATRLFAALGGSILTNHRIPVPARERSVFRRRRKVIPWNRCAFSESALSLDHCQLDGSVRGSRHLPRSGRARQFRFSRLRARVLQGSSRRNSHRDQARVRH